MLQSGLFRISHLTIMTLQQPMNGLLQGVAGRGDMILWATNENMTPRGPEHQHGQVVWPTGISLVLQDSRQSLSLICHETAVRHSHAHANVCTYTHTVWKMSVLSLGSFRDKLYKQVELRECGEWISDPELTSVGFQSQHSSSVWCHLIS